MVCVACSAWAGPSAWVAEWGGPPSHAGVSLSSGQPCPRPEGMHQRLGSVVPEREDGSRLRGPEALPADRLEQADGGKCRRDRTDLHMPSVAVAIYNALSLASLRLLLTVTLRGRQDLLQGGSVLAQWKQGLRGYRSIPPRSLSLLVAVRLRSAHGHLCVHSTLLPGLCARPTSVLQVRDQRCAASVPGAGCTGTALSLVTQKSRC